MNRLQASEKRYANLKMLWEKSQEENQRLLGEYERRGELLEKALPYLVDYQHIFEGDTIEDLNMLHYFIEDVVEELSDGD